MRQVPEGGGAPAGDSEGLQLRDRGEDNSQRSTRAAEKFFIFTRDGLLFNDPMERNHDPRAFL